MATIIDDVDFRKLMWIGYKIRDDLLKRNAFFGHCPNLPRMTKFFMFASGANSHRPFCFLANDDAYNVAAVAGESPTGCCLKLPPALRWIVAPAKHNSWLWINLISPCNLCYNIMWHIQNNLYHMERSTWFHGVTLWVVWCGYAVRRRLVTEMWFKFVYFISRLSGSHHTKSTLLIKRENIW